jgi:FMN phosphatase YigB (HAD superfamily)
VLNGGVVFLLDVDNTLLDNDRFGADLGERLAQAFGAEGRERDWAIFNARREEFGVAEYLGSLQAFRTGLDGDPQLLEISEYMLEYEFANLLYPQALAAIGHLGALGRPVVLSDGDVVFQPRKIRSAGIWDAVAGRVLIYLHKELAVERVEQRYPAAHYVMIDDKVRLLTSMKSLMGGKLTTIFVRQGHYALSQGSNGEHPPPDRVIERIGELTALDLPDFEVPP